MTELLRFIIATGGTQGSQQAGGSALWSMFIPIIIIFVVFYLVLIIPQKKQQKKHEQMINSLQKGDRVVTIGGIHGTVMNTKDSTIIVRVDDGTTIEFSKSAIAKVVSKQGVDLQNKK